MSIEKDYVKRFLNETAVHTDTAVSDLLNFIQDNKNIIPSEVFREVLSLLKSKAQSNSDNIDTSDEYKPIVGFLSI